MGHTSTIGGTPVGLRLGLFVLLVTMVWWHDAPPAAACSCAIPSELEGLEAQDAVFVGEYVRESAVSNLGHLVERYDDHGSVRGVRYEFDVDEVFKGDVAADQTVVSERSGMCGMSTPDIGTTYLVFATREPSGQLVSYLCGGTRPRLAPAANPLG